MPCWRFGEKSEAGFQTGDGNEDETGSGVGNGTEAAFVAPINLPEGERWMMGGLMKKEKGWRKKRRAVVQLCAHEESC